MAWFWINRALAVFYVGASLVLLQGVFEHPHVSRLVCALCLVPLAIKLAHAHFTLQPWVTELSALILPGVLGSFLLQWSPFFNEPRVSLSAIWVLAGATFAAVLNVWFARKLHLNVDWLSRFFTHGQ